jgi:hypothetical protein
MAKKTIKKKVTGRKSKQHRALAAYHKLHASPEPVTDRVVARRITTIQTGHDAFSHSKSTSVAEKIKLCRSAYYNVGIIGNVVDIMADFALEGLRIAHESESVERFYHKWAQITNLYETTEELLRDLFRDGNVPVVHYDANISRDSMQQMKKIIAGQTSRTEAADLFYSEPVEASVISYRFAVLDVLKVTVEDFDIFGRPNFYYTFDTEDIKKTLAKRDKETTELVQQMRQLLSPADWEKFRKTGKYRLRNLAMVFYKKDSYSSWAIPMLWRVIDDLKFKTTLRSMDISIAESIQNAVQIFRLGNTLEGLPPTEDMLIRFADMLKNPSKSKMMVWDDLISIESDYPDTGKVLGSDKYQQVNADILAGLGISEVLIGGPGGNYSNSFLSCRTLLERLETARAKVLKWINAQVMRIAKAMNFRKPPIVKFANMSLRDENAEKKMLLELVDRNIISYRTVLEHFDENLDIEMKRMRKEDGIRKRTREDYPHALKKLGKFGPQDQEDANVIELDYPNGLKKSQEPPKEFPSAQGPEGQLGGRPPAGKDADIEGETDKHENKRDTAPKGTAELLRTRAYQAYLEIKRVVSQHVSESRDVPIEDLNAQERDQVAQISMEVLARFDNIQDVNRNNILEAVFYKVTAPAKLDRCVRKVYRDLVRRYTKRTGKQPSEKQKDKLRSSAWAICRKQLGV